MGETVSRKLNDRLTELEAENRRLRAALVEQDAAARGFMSTVERAADKAVLDMKHDLELALGHLSQHQPYAEAVYNEIAEERTRQDMKHGVQNDLPDWLCHLFTMEEVGEVSKALLEAEVANNKLAPREELDGKRDDLYTEIIQAAACFVKWAQIINMRGQEVVDILSLVRDTPVREVSNVE